MRLQLLSAIFAQHKAAFVAATVLTATVFGGFGFVNTSESISNIKSAAETKTAAAAYAEAATDMAVIPALDADSDKVIVSAAVQKAEITQSAVEAVETAAHYAITEAARLTAETAFAQKAATEAAPAETTASPAETTAAPAETTAAPAQVQKATAPAATAASAAAAAPASLGDTSGSYDGTMAYAVLDLVNQQRAAAGLPGLTWNDTLAESASIRAAEIVVNWSHTRPDGSEWWTAGSQMEMGENLAYGQTSAEQAVSEWMASQGHADNILRTSFTEMGVSCYYCNGTYYWAQHFA